MSVSASTQLSTQDYLRTVARALETCAHGRKQAIIDDAKAWLGVKSAQAVYARVAEVGFDSGRNRRKDAGAVALSYDEASQIAAMLKATTRQNGKRLLAVSDAVDILRANGKIAAQHINKNTGEVRDLSVSAIINALRTHGVHPEQLAAPTPHIQLASLHPNHVWEMDFSVCVLFYLRTKSGLQVMKESDFNKNKPANVTKVENFRVLRCVIVDHTTHTLWLDYRLGAESAEAAIDTLIFAMLQRPGVPYYGVPFVLYTDRGSAFNNGVFANFCRRALIEHIMHESASEKDDAARATGSVEVMNNIVERRLESAFGIGYRVETLDQLRAIAHEFAAWFNATAKHTRHGMTRVEAWMKITEAQLRKPPAEDVLRSLAHTHPVTRTLTGNFTIPFAHKGIGSLEYSLRDIPGLEGLRVGEKVNVVINPYAQNEIIVVMPSLDGKSETHFQIAPIATNDWGYGHGAPIIGESFAAHADTDAQRANKRLAQIAMGVDTDTEAREAKKAKQIAFAGIDPHAHQQTPDVVYLPKRGTDLAADAPTYVAPIRMLSLADAALELRDRIGPDAWTPEHYATLSRLYPNGVAETDLDAAHARITTRQGLRIVSGGASA